MLHSLIAYDANGEVVATLDYMVAKDDEGNVIGLIDFAAHEEAGGKLRDIWEKGNAVGSGTWPEWLGARAHDFKVETAGGRISALVHKKSGHRRVRADIEAAVSERIAEAHAKHRKANGSDADVSQVAVDVRDILGGPTRPLLIDDDGKTKPRPKVTRPNLPIVAR